MNTIEKKNSTNKRTPFENLKPLREIENNMPAPKYKSQIIAPDENMDKFTNLQNNYHYGKRTDKRQTQREKQSIEGNTTREKRMWVHFFLKKKLNWNSIGNGTCKKPITKLSRNHQPSISIDLNSTKFCGQR